MITIYLIQFVSVILNTDFLCIFQAFVFWVTKSSLNNQSQMYELEVYVSALHRVVMDLLDYDPDTDKENITVYDSKAVSSTTKLL